MRALKSKLILICLGSSAFASPGLRVLEEGSLARTAAAYNEELSLGEPKLRGKIAVVSKS